MNAAEPPPTPAAPPSEFPFVVLEGTDGSGKSTVRDVLHRELQHAGHRCFMVGQHSWLDVEVARVLVAARQQRLGYSRQEISGAYARDKRLHVRHNVEPALPDSYVLADRYLYSDAAYHEVLYGIPAQETLHQHAVLGSRVPDLVIWVDVDPDTAYRRVLARGRALRSYETPENLRAFHASYTRVFALQGPMSAPLLRFDNTGPDLLERVTDQLLPRLLDMAPRPRDTVGGHT